MEQLADALSWDDRLDVLDVFPFGATEPPALSPEVVWLRKQLVASRGQARGTANDETGWSRRHVTNTFRRQLGIAPKAYAHLLRFQHATTLLMEHPEGRTLADIAMAAGYYDQSHSSPATLAR